MKRKEYMEWRLILKKISGQLTAEEEAIFQAWYDAAESHRRYFERAASAWTGEETPAKPDVEQAIARFNRARAAVRSRRAARWTWSAAAVVLLLSGAAWWWAGDADPRPVASSAPVLPGSPRARLEMAGGRHVDLKPAADSLWTDNGVTISREEGSVSYRETDAREADAPVAHALVVPRGGEYRVTLSDGTRVWINSGTRLEFPSFFPGDERVVRLSGEAYFEVTPGDRPFIVRTSRAEIRVYGTSFNVLAYEEDDRHRATLLEGRVGVTAGGREYALAPGQQAIVDAGDVEVREVDARLFCSWHKGALLFEGESLGDIMTRLSRWYNVGVVFADERSRQLHFTGDLERYANLDEVLRMIALTTRVTFEISNNEVFVK
jgi:ferric-dicitrate binding protein FerR (iron transport regulator)